MIDSIKCFLKVNKYTTGPLVRGGGTLHVTVSPDVVLTLHMDVGANNCIWIFLTQGIVRSVSNPFPLFVKTCLFYFVVGWDPCPCTVDLGGTFSVSQFRTQFGALGHFGCLLQLVFLSL